MGRELAGSDRMLSTRLTRSYRVCALCCFPCTQDTFGADFSFSAMSPCSNAIQYPRDSPWYIMLFRKEFLSLDNVIHINHSSS